MKKLIAVLLAGCVVLIFGSSETYAGKIENLNLKSSNGSTINVKTGPNSQIKNIDIIKDSKSKVKINNKEINCKEDSTKNGVCSPNSLPF